MTGRLFLHVVSVEARKQMSYRVDFWVNTVASFLVQMTIAVFLWQAIFAESGQQTIGGFDQRGMIVYYLLVLLIGRIVQGPDYQNTIAQDIYEGSLTRYLLYPARYVGFKYAEVLGGMPPRVLQLLIFGSATFFLADLGGVGAVSGGSVARGLLSIAVANLLAFLIAYLVQAVAFWADNVWSLSVMVRFVSNLLGGLMLPLTVFPPTARKFVEFLPFQHLFYIPTQTILGQIEPAAWASALLIALCWCFALGILTALVWRRGVLTYTGVGI